LQFTWVADRADSNEVNGRGRGLDCRPLQCEVDSTNWMNSIPPSSYDLTTLSSLNGLLDPNCDDLTAFPLLNASFDPSSYDLLNFTSWNNDEPIDWIHNGVITRTSNAGQTTTAPVI